MLVTIFIAHWMYVKHRILFEDQNISISAYCVSSERSWNYVLWKKPWLDCITFSHQNIVTFGSSLLREPLKPKWSLFAGQTDNPPIAGFLFKGLQYLRLAQLKDRNQKAKLVPCWWEEQFTWAVTTASQMCIGRNWFQDLIGDWMPTSVYELYKMIIHLIYLKVLERQKKKVYCLLAYSPNAHSIRI